MESKETTASKHLADVKEGQTQRKKIKLDRSAFNVNVSMSSTMSNGVKNELKPHLKSSESKGKDDKLNSPLIGLKKEMVSPTNSPVKRPAPSDSSDNDDVPLVVRSKSKTGLSQHAHKLDKAKTLPLQQTTKVSSKITDQKIKTENSLSPSVKKDKTRKPEGNDGIKKLKPESTSAKTDLVQKINDPGSVKNKGLTMSKEGSHSREKELKRMSEDEEMKSAKSSKVAKIKSEAPSPSKIDKLKPEINLNSKIDIVNKQMKSESGLACSVKTESNKTKSGSSSISKVENNKKSKQEAISPSLVKSEKIKKTKSEDDMKSSSKKQFKDNTNLTSSKVEGVKKVNYEKNNLSKKLGSVKDKEDMGRVSKTLELKKKKKEENGLTSPKDGIKQEKRESDVVKSVELEKKKVENVQNAKQSAEDSDDDVPLSARVKKELGSQKKASSINKELKRKASDDEDDDYKPVKKLKKKSDVGGKHEKKENVKVKSKEKEKEKKKPKESLKSPEKGKEGKGKKEEVVWKWWEEEKHPEGIKWLTLEHKGPYFPPEYEPLPDNVNFYYNGEKVKLSLKSEEVAGFYAKMLDHDYTTKKIFNDNFFEDWRKEMNDEERKLIKDLTKCDFKEIHGYYVEKNEERKNMPKEEKQKLKEKNDAILEEFGYCIMDGHKERVGNFKIEPPGLFRGRGDHPKQGKLKKRLQAKDIIINIGKDAKVPDPPEGQKWKAITHDNKVTWLACWIENIQGSYKYVMLNPTSRIKGEKDWQKYETARKLKNHIGKIRADYTNDWKSKEMRVRQRGVALYFIDKLALRAGHEKDEDTADTVGCCSLRYEHIKLHRQLEDKEYVVEFDFLGKDSIHYHNVVEVEKRVFKNLELFKQGKSDGDDLFDRLSTTSLNKYLSELMEGLSAKVFRTYNASMTLQDQLKKLEVENNVASKVLGYNRANRAVAILCNHQRSVPKTFEKSMSNLQQKIDDKHKAIKEAKKELKDLKAEVKAGASSAVEKKYEKKKTALDRLKEQLFKLEVSQTDKNENKEIALGTSKLNYLDPRISIAWCRKNDVPIEKIYNKTQRQKFAWAIDMTEEDFVF